MHYLTSMRGVAAFLVVLYHIKHWLHEFPLSNSFNFVYNKGYLAVDFFFVLSGFIIAFNYKETFYSQFKLTDFFRYVYRRFSRVFPLHLFVMICYLSIPFAYYFTSRPVNLELFGTLSFFVKLSLTDLWIVNSGFWNTWNVPSWTISGEFFSYLLFPILILAGGKSFSRNLFVGISVALLIAFSYHIIGARSLGDNIPQLGLMRCIGAFTIGITVFSVYTIRRNEEGKYASILFYSLAALLVALLVNFQQNHFYFPALVGVLLYFSLNFKGAIHTLLEFRPLVYLGEISYSVYLTHTFILTWVTLLFVNNNTTPQGYLIVLYLAAVIGFSSLTYKYIEVPARVFLNKRMSSPSNK